MSWRGDADSGADRKMPVGGGQGGAKRKGGGELVVQMGFCDVDSPPSSSTMMTV